MDMMWERGSTALVVVDMQNAFLRPEGGFAQSGQDIAPLRATIPGCVRLVDVAREEGIPVVFLQAVYQPPEGADPDEAPGPNSGRPLLAGSWEAELIDELAFDPARDHLVMKTRFSGFIDTDLDTLLRGMGVSRLAVCGITTSICVESTVRDAAQRDYACVVLADAVGEFDSTMHAATLQTLTYAFAEVTTVDDLLATERV